MKLIKIELADFSAAARLFPSKLFHVGRSKIKDRSGAETLVDDIRMDAGGNVWINRGLFVFPSSSLVYWQPENAESEWLARFSAPPPADDYHSPGFILPAADASGPPFAEDYAIHVAPAIEAAKEASRAAVARFNAEPVVEGPRESDMWKPCDKCDFTAKDARGLSAHVRAKHSG